MRPASSTDYLHQLNEQQFFAVTHADGPMLILAGAGSGKTRTLTYKIAYLIDQGICRPQEILAVTFTNKAADEMRERAERLLSSLTAAPLVCTFHSLAVRILRRYAQLLGYRPDFAICDQDDQKRILKNVYTDLGVSDNELQIRRVQATISAAKNKGWGPDEFLNGSSDFDAQMIHKIFSTYQRYLRQSSALDFDDLLLLSVQLLSEQAEIRQRYSNRYRYLLIDEYQDTNAPQYDLIKNLSCLHQNVSAVGDEDQSIYGFRGADISNILRFESDFPGARVVKLERNYRSTQTILDAATAVVSHNTQRKGKVLWTDKGRGELIDLYTAEDAREEALYVSHKIYQHLQKGESHLAVLYRANFQSRQFEEALRRLQISYRLIGGVSFYHRKEIKDALAYLRVAQNPEDTVSLLRIINEPARRIGRVTLDRLHQRMQEEEISLWKALTQSVQENVFAARTHLVLSSFCQIIEQAQELLELPLHLCLEKVLEISAYRSALQNEDTAQAGDRTQNLEELVSVAREYSEQGQSLQDFLDHAALRSDADDYDESAAVTLMTVHNAKGLEFPVVFLVGCEEGLFPHSRSVAEDDIEEERRLCYVGLTRAQKKLYLTYSRKRRQYGRQSDELNRPSRFLAEIPPDLLQVFAPRPSIQSARAQRVRTPRPFAGKTHNSPDSVREFLDNLERKKTANNQAFVSGATIVHDQFGRGRILQVQETGDDLKITVQFPGIGIKKMLQRYARLKLVL
ncbi:MAG: ATP-dependent helicase [Acidobacteriota bacterium]